MPRSGVRTARSPERAGFADDRSSGRGGLGISITFDSVSAATREVGTVAVPLDIPEEPTMLYLAHRTDHGKASVEAVLTLAEVVLPTVE